MKGYSLLCRDFFFTFKLYKQGTKSCYFHCFKHDSTCSFRDAQVPLYQTQQYH